MPSLKSQYEHAAVAEWLFGPQHAFVLRAAASIPAGFTAHMLAAAVGSDRPDLVAFVIGDLLSAELLTQHGSVYRLRPLSAIHKAVETITNGDLVEAAEMSVAERTQRAAGDDDDAPPLAS